MTKTKRMIFFLRPLEKTDAPVVNRWFLDLDDLALFDRSMRIPLNLEATEKNWAELPEIDGKGGKYWFTITCNQDVPIGIIGLESISVVNGDAVVPMCIERAVRNKGVGIRALSLVLDIAFLQLGLARITSYYRADNEVSRALTGRAGFSEEGRMRQAWFAGGERYDMIVIGLLREEWMERRGALAQQLELDTVVTFGRDTSGRWSWPPGPLAGRAEIVRYSRPESNQSA